MNHSQSGMHIQIYPNICTHKAAMEENDDKWWDFGVPIFRHNENQGSLAKPKYPASSDPHPLLVGLMREIPVRSRNPQVWIPRNLSFKSIIGANNPISRSYI